MFSGVSIAEEVDGVSAKVLGAAMTVDVQTLPETT
jgi:hypothetical protein